MSDNNPLLTIKTDKYNSIPFNKIKSDHFLPAIKICVKETESNINNICKCNDTPDFNNTIVAFENGEQKKAAARCESWCSMNDIFDLGISKYSLTNTSTKKVLLVIPSNIPLVGFHDFHDDLSFILMWFLDQIHVCTHPLLIGEWVGKRWKESTQKQRKTSLIEHFPKAKPKQNQNTIKN